MAASSALIVIVFNDGERLPPIEVPTRHERFAQWWGRAMAEVRLAALTAGRSDFASMVAVDPYGGILQYNTSEVAEVLGLDSAS